MLIVLGCVACGANQGSDPTVSVSVTAQTVTLPQFRSLADFPGGIIGYSSTPKGLIQTGNTVCLDIFQSVLPNLDEGLPIEITVDMLPVEPDDIEVRTLEETTMFCFSPYIDEGAHVIDVDLLTNDGLQVFTWDFRTHRQMGTRPYTLFPGQVTGFEGDFPNPFILVDENVCMTVVTRILMDEDYRSLVQVRVDDIDIEAESIDTISDSESIIYCFTLDDMSAGVHDVQVQLLTIGSDFSAENIGIINADVVQVGEIYGWEFVIDESE